MILVDNRPGEPTTLPLDIPAGTIADLDGARLRDFLVSVGGSAAVRFSFAKHELHPGRGGTIMFFSSAGPTAFGHLLKPDVSAPGGEILSSTLPEFAQAPFASFDGTSMATPHVAGAAALLLQRHPAWTTAQVRSALVSTAGPVWADTARTTEASVLLEGGGIIDIPGADDPKVFTRPSALSFGDLNANRGAVTRPLDARGVRCGRRLGNLDGRGQAAVGDERSLARGARARLGGPGRARAAARSPRPRPPRRPLGTTTASSSCGAARSRGASRTRSSSPGPALEGMSAAPLRRFQNGTTANGPSRVNSYRWPSAPFGLPPSVTGPPMIEDGAEHVYVVPHLKKPVVNFGVGVVGASANAVIDPWLLGSLDENDVQGETGTPMNVNPLTFDFGLPIGAAGVVFPSLRRYYVAVDSTQDLFTGKALRGRYRLRYWVNDLRPPVVRLLTRRVAVGRPTLAIRAQDSGAGIDPYSMLIAYQGVAVGAAAYDSSSGIAIFVLPSEAPRVPRGRNLALLAASDFQESKNVSTFGPNVMPNTRFRFANIRGVRGTTMTWLLPRRRGCLRGNRQELLVLANTHEPDPARALLQRASPDRDGSHGRRPGSTRSRGARGKARKGLHRLRAVAIPARGRAARTSHVVRVCR